MKYLNLLLATLLTIGLFTTAIADDDDTETPEIPYSSQSSAQMTAAAAAFLDSLYEDQASDLIFEFSDDPKRTGWSNVPVSSRARNGLPIGRLSLEQRKLLHLLLITSTSSQGYQKIWGAVRSDDALKQEGENRELSSMKFFSKNQSLGAINYWVSFYGDPRTEANWGYMFTGHHLAANFTVVDDKATFVPMFYGSDPATIGYGAHAGHVFISHERERGLELLKSLTDKQRDLAVVADKVEFNKFGAVAFRGPGSKDKPIKPQGITADKLDNQQQKLLWVLIEEYVSNADFDVSEKQIEKIRNDGLDALTFMWMGPTDGTEKIFYQIYSPSILINFVDQGTEFDWNTHPHIIVRDPSNDYVEDWLERHISENY